MSDDEEFVANVLDESFFSNPLDIGDRVVARWSASDIKLLGDGPLVAGPVLVETAIAKAR
jgi:putative spermidine/putrescine transport system ATP-binding protein